MASKEGTVTNNKPTAIDDSYLHLFSEENKLDSTKGYFTGFPSAVVHKGIIYLIVYLS